MKPSLRNFERKLLVHLGISGVEMEAEGADQRGQSEDHHHHHHHARDKRTGRPLEREFNFLSVMHVTQCDVLVSNISPFNGFSIAITKIGVKKEVGIDMRMFGIVKIALVSKIKKRNWLSQNFDLFFS